MLFTFVARETIPASSTARARSKTPRESHDASTTYPEAFNTARRYFNRESRLHRLKRPTANHTPSPIIFSPSNEQRHVRRGLIAATSRGNGRLFPLFPRDHFERRTRFLSEKLIASEIERRALDAASGIQTPAHRGTMFFVRHGKLIHRDRPSLRKPFCR